MIIEVLKRTATGEIRAKTYVDHVPYYGSGDTLEEALLHLVAVLRDHGAPAPGQTWTNR
jgi:hypothetical protein